ncbi:MAG: hypothetical protein MZW92_43075 [Comamonadaceae bacterium]|nr:hypothetical protein [Comamonadaceae bacterium]
MWDRKPRCRAREPDGSAHRRDARWWLVVVPLAVAFAFVWAVVLLTYLLPPLEVYGNLFTLAPDAATRRIFIAAATAGAERRVPVRAPPVLPLRLRRRPVPEPRPGWATADGMVVGFERDRAARLRDACRRSACDARLPDAAQAAQHQAAHVHLHPVRPVHRRLRHGAARQPATAPLLRLGRRRGGKRRGAAANGKAERESSAAPTLTGDAEPESRAES